MLDQLPCDRRHAAGMLHLLALDDLHRLLGLPFAHEDHGRAGDDRRHQPGAARSDVEQRDDQQRGARLRRLGNRVAAAQQRPRAGIAARENVRADVAVGAQRALGIAGGSAGVEDRRIVVGRDRHVRKRHVLEIRPVVRRADQHLQPAEPALALDRRARAADHHAFQVGQRGIMVLQPLVALPVDERDLRARVGEAIFQLAAGPPGVQRHDDRTDRSRREEDHRPFGQVAHRQRHAVALADAVVVQPVRQMGGRAIIGLIGDALVLIDGEVAVAIGAHQLRQHAQRRREILPDPRRDAANVDGFHLEPRAGGGQRRRDLGERHLGPVRGDRHNRLGSQGASSPVRGLPDVEYWVWRERHRATRLVLIRDALKAIGGRRCAGAVDHGFEWQVWEQR